MHIDLIFKHPHCLDDLNERLGSNPRFIFYLHKDSGRDKRTRLARVKGRYVWRHKRKGYEGDIKLVKNEGVFWVDIADASDGLLTGAFFSWLQRNAADLIAGANVRF